MTEKHMKSKHGSSLENNFSSSSSNSNLISFPNFNENQSAYPISFDRKELDQLLNVYGFKVGDGEWRDYAIDMLKDRAIFSVFLRQGDVPVFRIEKNPKLAKKQGAYSILNASGQTLKRGHELASLLQFFKRKPRLHSI